MGRPPVPVVSRAVRAGSWTLVASRSYGTTVYRVDGPNSYYVKSGPRRERDDLRFHPPGEAERLIWLGRLGFPVPDVVEVGEDADTMWLVTTAIEGRLAAERWKPAEEPTVVDMVADLARALHSLPAEDCPFDRSLTVSLSWARVATREGMVDTDDLDERHRGWTAEQLLAELDTTPVPGEEVLVVCHGDLCLDNVLVKPGTMTLAGICDVGRLGIADRWLDLSVVLRNLTEECEGWHHHARHADNFLRRYGLSRIDERKRHYYRLLDEFV